MAFIIKARKKLNEVIKYLYNLYLALPTMAAASSVSLGIKI